jgi:hypothetical protein
MRLNKLCSMDLTYTDGFTLIRPYAGESGLGWGWAPGRRVATASAGRSSGPTIRLAAATESCCRPLAA